MDKISYFKLQAKNLLRDFKSQKMDLVGNYFYSPKFFEDIDDLIISFDIDEDNFALMKAQHLIAHLAGFDKWSDLLHASDDALELGKLLFDHRNQYGWPLREDWDMFIIQSNFQDASDASKLELFKAAFVKT